MKQFFLYLRRDHIWVYILCFVVLVVEGGVVYTVSYQSGFHRGIEQWKKLTKELQYLKTVNQQQGEENRLLHKKLSSLKQQYAIDKATTQKFKAEIKDLLDQNDQLKNEQMLYQLILEQSKVKPRIGVKQFQILPTSSKAVFRYRLVLTASAQSKKILKGHIKLAVIGKMNNNFLTIQAPFIGNAKQEKMKSFNFKHVQAITGVLSLPLLFQPTAVLVHIISDFDPALNRQEIVPWRQT